MPVNDGSDDVGQTAEAVTNGTTYELKAPNIANKCADVSSNSPDDGANVQLWTCNGSTAQKWVAQDKGGGWFSLQHSGTDRCLNRDTSGNNSNGGGNVQQWWCGYSGSNEFQWQFQSSNGYQQIVNRYDGRCLDVSGSNSADGTNIQTWGCNTTNAQTWNPVSGGGGGGSGIQSVITESQFNSWFPSRASLYTYWGFVSMNDKYGYIANQGDWNLRKREVAALLANFGHETGDFVYTREITPTCGCDWSCGCPAGDCNYYGRGWTQLTWSCNYLHAGQALGYDLLNNPDWVATNPNISAQTAAWYWATQYGPGGAYANSHDCMENSNGGGGFGCTIAHINGSLECPSLGGGNTAQRDARINRYRTYCDRLGCNGYGNNISC